MGKSGDRRDVVPLSLAFAAILALMALFLGACAEDETPLPQERSDVDLDTDPDAPGQSALLLATDDANPPVDPPFASARAAFRYDRARARTYIERYAKNPNPQTAYCAIREKGDKIPADCTSFASQVLWYGRVPMEVTSSDEEGWWYRYGCSTLGSSKSWRQVNRLLSYLVTESDIGEYRTDPHDLEIGDLIFYRLRREEDGYRCDTGNLFNHTAVVSGFDARGEPLVSYHSNDAIDVPWAAHNGSKKALGEACLVAFVHIRD